MNPLEPLALGFEAVRRALRELGSPPCGSAWALLALPLLLAVVALAFAAHPLLAGLLVGPLEATGLAGVLHYPDHFEVLPVLTRRAIGAAMLMAVPVLSAATMLHAHARWHGLPAPRWRELWPRVPAYLVVTLPVLVAIGALHAALPLLDEVRLSSVTRRVLPVAAGLLTWLLQAAGAWLLPRVVLAGLSPLQAWREWPQQMTRGFVPALVVTGLVSLLPLLLDAPLDAAPSWIARGMPEAVVGWGLLRVLGMVAAAWLLSMSMALLHEALPQDESSS